MAFDRISVSRLLLATFVSGAIALPCPSAAGPSVLHRTAWVIHGNDRTLATVALPGGPVTANVAALPAFPNEIAIRGDRGYVVCSGGNAIVAIDLATGSPVDTIPTGAGTNPWSIAVTSDTRAYVTLFGTNQVAAIDLAAGMIDGLIAVGRSPEGITEASGRLFVANSGFNPVTFGYDPGTVSVIDPGTNAVTHTLPVGLNPQSLDAAPDGAVHVCCTGNYFSVFGKAFVIDAALPAVVDSVAIGGSPGFLSVSPAGAAYLSDYFLGLLKYDTVTRLPLRDGSNPIVVGTGAAGIDFDDLGNTYVPVYDDDQVVVLDAADNLVQAFPTGDGPQDVAVRVAEEPVSVRLASFTATVEPGGVRLDWTTSAETDHAGFRVYRSDDGNGNWRRLGGPLIPADSRGTYRWVDADAVARAGTARTLSYRLGAVDRSGAEELLPPLMVTMDVTPGVPETPLRVSPNPVRGAGASIFFEAGTAGRADLRIFDASGRSVRTFAVDGAAGGASIHWDGRADDGTSLAGGVYFVRLETGGAVRTARVALVP